MSDHPSLPQPSGNHVDLLQTLAGKLEHGSDEEVADAIFDGWEGTYGEGRRMLLERMRYLRAQVTPKQRDPIGQRVFRLLVTVGEESGDMRFVHLGVESRDLIVYGY